MAIAISADTDADTDMAMLHIVNVIKCNFLGKKYFFFNFPNFSGIDFYKSILGISFGGDFNEFLYKIEPKSKHRNSYSIPIVYSRYEL